MKTAASQFMEERRVIRPVRNFIEKHKGFVDLTKEINQRFIALCLNKYQSLIRN